MIQSVLFDINQLEFNTGQIAGVPKNPRFIRNARFDALKRSIRDTPEMLELRECIVFPLNGGNGKNGKSKTRHVVIGGNQRLRACRELGHAEIPVKVLAADTSPEKLRAFAIKDNIGFGEDDFDALANEWDIDELTAFGMEIDFKKIDEMEIGETIDIPQSVQLQPPMEYIVIMANPNSESWEELKERLKLQMVRRGGYRDDSTFNHLGLERVLTWEDFKSRVGID